MSSGEINRKAGLFPRWESVIWVAGIFSLWDYTICMEWNPLRQSYGEERGRVQSTSSGLSLLLGRFDAVGPLDCCGFAQGGGDGAVLGSGELDGVGDGFGVEVFAYQGEVNL